MKKFIFILLFACTLNLFAAPYNGKIQQFKQPDGSLVDLKLFGTEFYMRAEGLDGYTLIRDKVNNWICYAQLSADQTELISTGIIYKGQKDVITSLKNNLNIPKHIDISVKSREKTILQNQKKLGKNPTSQNQDKTAPHPVIGNINGLCIVVDFSDEVGTLPMTEFTNFCNNLTYNNFGNNGSLKTYYSDMSGGLVNYQNVVYGYYRAPLTFAAYEQMPYAQGAQQILGLALNWIQSTGFDFSTLSTNPDGSIMAINLMYTGIAQNWAQGMWYHQGYYGSFSANGVHSGDYNCSPANAPLGLATVVHENGHMIGKWPDTYKYDNLTGPDGIGAFDLMCWYGDDNNPVPPNPHFWSNAGWGKVVDVSYYNGTNSDTANSLTCYKYNNPNDTNEFFLLENRSQTGRSTFIEDNGLTIWHINRMGDNQTTSHEVYLVHANNDINDHSAACFHSGFNTEYGISTTPNSNFFNGNPSGLRVWSIGPVNNIMTYKLGAGVAAPSFSLTYNNVTGDANSNGFLEPGESGNVNISASNFGQLSSGNANITCTAIGTNASYVTVNSPVFNAGIINISQTIPVNHNITIAPGTPLGTVIDLKFEISDGTYSNYITKSLVIGVQVIMADQSIQTCSALFFDAGGIFSNYSNSTDYITTFTALSASNPVKANFTLFDLEDETNCSYDYLKIYNGPTTSSTLIGTFCGTNSPGIITSTHSSGALTFKFHADEGVTGAGWQATISCVGITEVAETNTDNQFLLYPNPFNNYCTLVSSLPLKNANISIYDILGKEVRHYENLSGKEITIQKEDLKSGMYFFKIADKSGFVGNGKMVVE
ncbi:MAG: M6 family metalloprotease domain-containing protein [Bacteroidetes bacterium]|nr:M6 family metalloprotease domain-containing protein [Bacteroidota bacterium]